MPFVDDTQAPPRVGFVDDTADDITGAVNAARQRATALPPPTLGNVARAALGMLGGGALADVAGAGRQGGTPFVETPARVGQFAVEEPAQAAGMAAAMLPAVALGIATQGASIPAQLAAQGAAGVIGEGARQVITGEPRDPRLLAAAGAVNAIPVTGGVGPIAAKSAAVGAADQAIRTGLTEGRWATPEELEAAAGISGLAGGGFAAAGRGLERYGAQVADARQRVRQDAADVAGGTPAPWFTDEYLGVAPETMAGRPFPQAGFVDDTAPPAAPEVLTGAPPPVPDLSPRQPQPAARPFFPTADAPPADAPAIPPPDAQGAPVARPPAAAPVAPAEAPPVQPAAPAAAGAPTIRSAWQQRQEILAGIPGATPADLPTGFRAFYQQLPYGWQGDATQALADAIRTRMAARTAAAPAPTADGTPRMADVVGRKGPGSSHPVAELYEANRQMVRAMEGAGDEHVPTLAEYEQALGAAQPEQTPSDVMRDLINERRGLKARPPGRAQPRAITRTDRPREVELRAGDETILVKREGGAWAAYRHTIDAKGRTVDTQVGPAGLTKTRAVELAERAMHGDPLTAVPAEQRSAAARAWDTYPSQGPLRSNWLTPDYNGEPRPFTYQGTEFVSDGHVAFRAAAVAPAQMKKLRALAEGAPSRELPIGQIWDGAVAAAKQDAAVVGWLDDYEAGGQHPVAMIQGAKGQPLYVQANKLAMAQAATGADGLRMNPTEGAPVVLTKAGEPVALVMPMRVGDTERIKPKRGVAKLREERGSIPLPQSGRLVDIIARGRRYVGELREEGRRLQQEQIAAELSAARARPFGGAVGDRGLGPGAQTAPGTDRRFPATRGRMSSTDADSFSPSLIEGDIYNVLNRVGGINRDDVEWARRGKVPVALTRMRADELAGLWARSIGADPERINQMREKGQVPNAEEMLAMKYLADRFGARAIRTAETAARTGTLSDSIQAVLDAASSTAMWTQAQAGASEIGRALNILRKAAYGPAGAQNAAMRKAVEYFGGTDKLEEIVTRIRMFRPEEIDQLNAYMASVAPKRWGDKALAAYYFSLLANIPGRVVDFLSTLHNAGVRRPVERTFAAAADTVLSTVRGSDRTRWLADARDDLVGQYAAGLRAGTRAAMRTLITQQPSEGFSRFREIESTVRPFRSELANTVAAVPRSIIEASDDFNAALTYNGFLYGEAGRIARSEGRTGQAFVDRMAEIIEDPRAVDGLWERALRERDERVFKGPLRPWQQTLLKLINYEVPGKYIRSLEGLKPARFVMPFYRVSVKLYEAGVQDAFRLPAVVYMAATHQLPKDQGELADLIARTTYGSMIAAAGLALAAEGYLTGPGPLDPKAAERARSTGWAANSINFGGADQWEYRRFEPIGTTLGLVAGLYEGWPMLEQDESAARASDWIGRMATYGSQAATGTGAVLLKQAINAPYVKGLSDAYDAAHDPRRYGQAFLNSQVAAFIPGIVRQTAIAMDPTVRQPKTLRETIQARIPGATGGGELAGRDFPPVPPMIDVWGRDVVRRGGFWEILTSPFPRRELYMDPASVAIRELGWQPGSPARYLDFRGARIQLPAETYSAYARAVGSHAFDQVTNLVESGAWENMEEPQQRKNLERIWKQARRVAKADIMPELLDLRDEAED